MLYATSLLSLATGSQGPCDITGAAGQPCVAAHSTVRALYGAYSGPLYNVTRTSDGQSLNIGVLESGFANIATHDAFCAKGDCVVSNIYDQSPQKNHLKQRHKLVNASQHKIIVRDNGTNISVYGLWFDPGYGYHQDNTTGIATGNEEESIYAVMSGTHYNGKCCFDYGNSETDDHSDGAGTMEAIYFGNAHWQGNGGAITADNPDGPWVGADFETGMYYGGGEETKVNNKSKPLPFPFVSLYLRGRAEGFMLKGGDATQGELETMWDGDRPYCSNAGTCGRHVKPGQANHTYQPASKQGAIILATGGDSSNGAMGKFYEGIMVTGVTNDTTDAAVQANIVAVGYANIPEPLLPPAKPVGCYKDGHDDDDDDGDDGRDLPVCATKQMTTQDPIEECGRMCLRYAFFALENGKECRCGNDAKRKYPASTDPARDCSMPCGHNATVMCGGFYFENVYSH